jgi:hypothetical protein
MNRVLTAAMLVLPALIGGAASAVPEKIDIPRRLVESAGRAGSRIEAAEIVEGSKDGLFDRRGGTVLHISRAALDAATSADERTLLLAISLSYRLGYREPAPTTATRIADGLATIAAADVDEIIAARDRADPYLKLPASSRLWQPAPAAGRTHDPEPVALRALAWAKASGVCEATAVAYLNRLRSLGASNRMLAGDARTALDDLGFIRFVPDDRCPTA